MLKNVSIVLILFTVLCGCATIKDVDSVSIVTAIDFTKYSNKDFLITPYSYNGKYKSCGIIESYFKQGAKRDHTDSSFSIKWIKDEINLEMVIEEVYNKCIKMGADALIDFDVEIGSRAYNIDTNHPVAVKTYTITGFAIKRLE